MMAGEHFFQRRERAGADIAEDHADGGDRQAHAALALLSRLWGIHADSMMGVVRLGAHKA